MCLRKFSGCFWSCNFALRTPRGLLVLICVNDNSINDAWFTTFTGNLQKKTFKLVNHCNLARDLRHCGSWTEAARWRSSYMNWFTTIVYYTTHPKKDADFSVFFQDGLVVRWSVPRILHVSNSGLQLWLGLAISSTLWLFNIAMV